MCVWGGRDRSIERKRGREREGGRERVWEEETDGKKR